MNIEDADSVDTHYEYEESHDSNKPSKRGRLKDALNRTKTKISRVKEEREAKKYQQQHKVEDDVNDFLAAGRPSIASSQRPSIASATSDPRQSHDTSSPSPRPSTSDSKSQSSPRRGPPIVVPRIDVSTSTRFPQAKEIDSNALVRKDSDAVSSGSAQSSGLLKPEYKGRSQSSSSIASGDRKARIRGLSVGFADTPPVIIGEGGDEAQAPAIEISRAKARARSASPQGRKFYSNANAQQEASRQMPTRAVSETTADAFVPKPNRAQTATALDGAGQGTAQRSPPDDFFVPKPLTRVQTGAVSGVAPPTPDDDFVPTPFARVQTGFSDKGSPHPTHIAPAIPVRQPETKIQPRQLPPMQTSGLDLTKEFEMTLGMGSPAGNSPMTTKPAEPQILQPKPKRAAPSYDLIESGGQPPKPTTMQQVGAPAQSRPEHLQHQTEEMPSSSRTHYTIGTSQRKPTPQSQMPQQAPNSGYQPQANHNMPRPPPNRPPLDARDRASNLPPTGNQAPTHEYYPPPPQRTLTQTARIQQKLERIAPRQPRRDESDQQETGVVYDEMPTPVSGRDLQPASSSSSDYRSFADRQRANPRAVPSYGHPPPAGLSATRPIMTDQYERSPSEYGDFMMQTPATATERTPTNMRFYDRVNKGSRPEGFI